MKRNDIVKRTYRRVLAAIYMMIEQYKTTRGRPNSDIIYELNLRGLNFIFLDVFDAIIIRTFSAQLCSSSANAFS